MCIAMIDMSMSHHRNYKVIKGYSCICWLSGIASTEIKDKIIINYTYIFKVEF
jgi:hypothetical protein